MMCRADLRSDAARWFGTVYDTQVHRCDINVDHLIEEFHVNELKTMFFLLMTDLYDKGSVSNYLQLIKRDEQHLKLQFCEKWHERKFSLADLTELLGTMKKFKHMKNLGTCKHAFKKKQSTYKTVPEICKFIYSICEELDDGEIRILQHNIFPNVSESIGGEELICLMLLHEKIDSNDFNQLKQPLLSIRRKDLVTKIETYEEQYPIRQPTFQKPSGLAMIINENKFTESEPRLFLDERKGSEIDCRNLEKLWIDFGFKVEIHIDLTMSGISSLTQHLQCRDLSPYDIFVLCIMSHGQKGCFYSSDSRVIDIDSFVNELADKCMFGKPKLIFVQACQGDQHNKGVPVCSELFVPRKLAVDSRLPVETVPRHADIFKAMATIDNHVSYRDEQDGSLFVSHLVKKISKYGDKEDIQAVLTKVKNDVSKENAAFDGKLCKQQPISTSTLRKKVVLKRVEKIV